MAIIVDIDGTIADCSARVKYLDGTAEGWDAFYAACGEDQPIPDIIHVVGVLARAHKIVFISGRRESCRPDTEKWLRESMPSPVFRDGLALYLRGSNDHRHDTEVKPELLEKAIKDGVVRNKDAILCILEDRNSMVRKWRELGYTCLQVADGDFQMAARFDTPKGVHTFFLGGTQLFKKADAMAKLKEWSIYDNGVEVYFVENFNFKGRKPFCFVRRA